MIEGAPKISISTYFSQGDEDSKPEFEKGIPQFQSVAPLCKIGLFSLPEYERVKSNGDVLCSS
jgi:hypothetical protein